MRNAYKTLFKYLKRRDLFPDPEITLLNTAKTLGFHKISKLLGDFLFSWQFAALCITHPYNHSSVLPKLEANCFLVLQGRKKVKCN
jgi:hypothetical protein